MPQVGFIPIGCGRFDLNMCAVVLRRAVAIFVLTFAVGGAAAEDFSPLPSMARVANILGNDILNVRARATVESRDIGDLSPGERVEVVRLNDDGSWAQIIVTEGNGWISTKYLEPVARPQSNGGLPLNLTCTGTEPFWSLQLGPDEAATLKIAAAAEQVPMVLEWSGASRNLGPGAYGFSGVGSSGVLRRAQCFDGMSDREYGWAIDIILLNSNGSQLYSGCCTGN